MDKCPYFINKDVICEPCKKCQDLSDRLNLFLFHLNNNFCFEYSDSCAVKSVFEKEFPSLAKRRIKQGTLNPSRRV